MSCFWRFDGNTVQVSNRSILGKVDTHDCEMQSTGFVVAANSFLRSQNCNYHLKPTIMKPARDVVYRTAYDTSHILSKNSITGRYRCDELAIQSLLNCLIDRIDYSSENRQGTNMIRLGRLDNQKEYLVYCYRRQYGARARYQQFPLQEQSAL